MTTAAESSADGKFSQALALHQQCLFEDARMLYEQVLERQPRHVQALTFLSVLALQSKEPERALELTSRALRVEPASPAIHLMQGHAQVELKRFEGALASYDSAIRLKADLADAYFHRGNVLNELGRHQS